MTITFPTNPPVGTLAPQPTIPGAPLYRWDGTVWNAIATPEALTYVRRAGDTMGGPLTITYTATPTQGALYLGNAGNSLVWDGAKFFMSGPLTAGGPVVSTGQIISNTEIVARGAVFTGYAGTTGAVYFGNSGAVSLSHDAVSFIFTGGGVLAAGFCATANVYRFTDPSGSRYLMHDGTNYVFGAGGVTTSGSVSVTGGITATGGASITGSIHATGDIGADGNLVAVGSLITSANVQPYGNILFNAVYGANRWTSDGNIVIGTKGYQPGGGDWADSSDIRIKTVEAEYTSGLDQVCALRPVVYKFKGNDTLTPPVNAPLPPEFDKAGNLKEVKDTRSAPAVPYPNSGHYQAAQDDRSFIGMVAQEVQAIFPEMITKQRGFIDGKPVDDLLILDTSSLIFALVNAVKELSARVKALETG